MKDLVSDPEPGAHVGWSQGWDLHYGRLGIVERCSTPTPETDVNQSRPWTGLGSHFSLPAV